jgi:hypothetical protein
MSKTILAVLAALMLSSVNAHAGTDDDDDFLRALHQLRLRWIFRAGTMATLPISTPVV